MGDGHEVDAHRRTAVGCLVRAALAQGEVIVLRNGGRIEGTLVNPKEVPREKYVVKTASGGEVTLAKDQVKEVVRQNPRELEYNKIRPQYPDTVEGQWALAEWCREQSLTEARNRHLQRVIELEPNHKAARAALRYVFLDGQWKTRDQIFQERGYVKDASGQWKLPQEIEETARREKQDKAEKEWFANIKRWRGWLTGGRAEEAQHEFGRIKDPNAVPAIKKNLEDERLEAVRKLYIQILGRIGSPAALQVLAIASMEDVSEDIRLSCLEHLAKDPQPSVIDFYVQRLRHKDNIVVNRAADGLGQLKATSALRPLVDALVTTHRFQLPSAPEGQYSTTFSPNGGVPGYTFGGGGPKFITKQIPNQSVRDALVKLSGVDFEFNVRAWRNWLSTQKKPQQNVAGRRD